MRNILQNVWQERRVLIYIQKTATTFLQAVSMFTRTPAVETVLISAPKQADVLPHSWPAATSITATASTLRAAPAIFPAIPAMRQTRAVRARAIALQSDGVIITAHTILAEDIIVKQLCGGRISSAKFFYKKISSPLWTYTSFSPMHSFII